MFAAMVDYGQLNFNSLSYERTPHRIVRLTSAIIPSTTGLTNTMSNYNVELFCCVLNDDTRKVFSVKISNAQSVYYTLKEAIKEKILNHQFDHIAHRC
jgi:Crinkler effector protein N-terminal domain